MTPLRDECVSIPALGYKLDSELELGPFWKSVTEHVRGNSINLYGKFQLYQTVSCTPVSFGVTNDLYDKKYCLYLGSEHCNVFLVAIQK